MLVAIGVSRLLLLCLQLVNLCLAALRVVLSVAFCLRSIDVAHMQIANRRIIAAELHAISKLGVVSRHVGRGQDDCCVQ